MSNMQEIMERTNAINDDTTQPNIISRFEQYLVNNFDKLNTKNVKEFVDYIINSDDFQEQLDYFVEHFIIDKE